MFLHKGLQVDHHPMTSGPMTSGMSRPGGEAPTPPHPCSECRFGAASIKPIHPRPNEAAIRIIVYAVKGSRAALSLRPPLVLHEAGSRFSAEADALINGSADLFG